MHLENKIITICIYAKIRVTYYKFKTMLIPQRQLKCALKYKVKLMNFLLKRV